MKRPIAWSTGCRLLILANVSGFAAARHGEALALRVKDVHRPPQPGMPWLITVAGTVITPGEGKTFRQPFPKHGKGSFRTVPVAGFAAEALTERLALVADVADPNQTLFFSRRGTLMQAGNLRRTWRAIRTQDHVVEELDDITPHALRRTLATLLEEFAGGDYAASYIGLSGTQTLYSNYVQYINRVDPAFAHLLDKLDPGLALEA